MLIVKKFGGSSVANKQRIFNVAKRCIEDYQKGNDVVVVLSAMGDTTDELLEKAADINPKATKEGGYAFDNRRAGICFIDGDGNPVTWSSGGVFKCVAGKYAVHF